MAGTTVPVLPEGAERSIAVLTAHNNRLKATCERLHNENRILRRELEEARGGDVFDRLARLEAA